MRRVWVNETQNGVVRWWWISVSNQERLHGGSDLGLFFKIFEFGLKILPYLWYWVSWAATYSTKGHQMAPCCCNWGIKVSTAVVINKVIIWNKLAEVIPYLKVSVCLMHAGSFTVPSSLWAPKNFCFLVTPALDVLSPTTFSEWKFNLQNCSALLDPELKASTFNGEIKFIWNTCTCIKLDPASIRCASSHKMLFAVFCT